MEHGTQAFNPHHMHEEFREFVGAGRQRFGLFAQHRIIRKQFRIKDPRFSALRPDRARSAGILSGRP